MKRETRVHLVNLIVGIVIVVVSIAYVLYTQHQDRVVAARAVCENTNEFRSFMSSYLDSQVGKPPQQAPGYNELTPEVKEFIDKLNPVLDQGRATRQAYANAYRKQFPVLDCG